VIDALERAMQGCRPLLDKPAPSVAFKTSSSEGSSMKSAASCRPWTSSARCAISCTIWRSGTCRRPASSAVRHRERRAASHVRRAALLDAHDFSTLRQEEKDTFSQNMTLQTFRAGETILPAGRSAIICSSSNPGWCR
jgi:hypothetical protein